MNGRALEDGPVNEADGERGMMDERTGLDRRSQGHTPTDAELAERQALFRSGAALSSSRPASSGATRRGSLKRRPIGAPDVLNEAPSYSQPASFSRGVRIDLPGGVAHLMISGTASVGASGETLHAGDFGAQCWRAYRNLSRLLESQGATWHDVVRCNCYLRDMARDYAAFNEVRTEFFTALGLDPLPASTATEARLCRDDLLVEIDLHAILEREVGDQER